MKKEELRIGNWYLSVKFGVPVRCELSDLYELCVKSDGAYNDPPIDEMFKPIPLTRAWLIELRFYNYGGKDIWKQHVKNIKDKPNKVTINSWKQRDNYPKSCMYLNDFPFTKIRYVHELQNIYFALTGEELKTDKL